MIEEIAKQAAQVAVPIVAIGIIIAVAIQSNLALKFSSQLIELSGGTLLGAMLLIIVGCIIMGMGLPTVAAYIIGAILFVPALTKLGIEPLAAHFFVMYYCVLSMITPPVALASYAAAGLAKADSMKTGWYAFKLSFVLFLIPFAFAFDPALLWTGPLHWIALAFALDDGGDLRVGRVPRGLRDRGDRVAAAPAVRRRRAHDHLRADGPRGVVGGVRRVRRAARVGAVRRRTPRGGDGRCPLNRWRPSGWSASDWSGSRSQSACWRAATRSRASTSTTSACACSPPPGARAFARRPRSPRAHAASCSRSSTPQRPRARWRARMA